jgi:hypothetical protein
MYKLLKCCSSMPPLCQGLILGIIIAGLLLVIVIVLWVTSMHVTSTTSNINTQVSTSEFLFYMSDLWNTAMSIHRIQTFEFSAWLNFAQNRMRNRTKIEDLHWSSKSSYSFSINFVLHDQYKDELIIIAAATTTTETTSTSTTATSKIENDETYIYNWTMFYCRFDFGD